MKPQNTSNSASQKRNKILKNPWPRLAMATGLMVWAGSNLWSAIDRWSDINNAEIWNRGAGMLLTILVTALPLVIGIYLIWSVVVGPDDAVANRPKASSKIDLKKGKQT